ncbi:hypothetical protein CCHL11_09620 [Colletotrichum chlorophyti]|uniref:Uncharacterized protein n=1 Tax=Colletotrichum chlorophyti TaxID=708187 RepID=A0A1Q8S8B1_9PEZI|nr:hypothetical protein CCHL11_09620 [Colletotrichum chlorophyti]
MCTSQCSNNYSLTFTRKTVKRKVSFKYQIHSSLDVRGCHFCATLEAMRWGRLANTGTVWIKLGSNAINTLIVRYPSRLKDYWRAHVCLKPEQIIICGNSPTTVTPGNRMPDLPYLTPYLQYLTRESIQADGSTQADFMFKVNYAEVIATAQALQNGLHCSRLTHPKELENIRKAAHLGDRQASCYQHVYQRLSRADYSRLQSDGVQVKFSVTSGPNTKSLEQALMCNDRAAALQIKTGLTSLFLAKARMNAAIQEVSGRSRLIWMMGAERRDIPFTCRQSGVYLSLRFEPDGSASVTSFFQLPQLSANHCVYELHSF